MIAYVDSSFLVRAYLADEVDHDRVVALLEDGDVALVTGSWTRIEVTGALVRAARAHRGDEEVLLQQLERDLSYVGTVTVVQADQRRVEREALVLARDHGVRAMDAWHLAVAAIVLPLLGEADETRCFASRDDEQSTVAALLGLEVL